MKTNQLQKNIMRRVYYTFMLRLVAHPLLSNTAIFGGALVVFARMVHVERVIDALLSIPLRSVPNFMLSALSHGEILTLISMVLMGFAMLRVGKYIGRLAAYQSKSQLVAY
jgi:hypothetical protein